MLRSVVTFFFRLCFLNAILSVAIYYGVDHLIWLGRFVDLCSTVLPEAGKERV